MRDPLAIQNYFKNLPKMFRQPTGWWTAINRTLWGQAPQTINEAVLMDTVDLIPIVGDLIMGQRIVTQKGNRLEQLGDWFIGIVPIIGDGLDLAFAADTNISAYQNANTELKEKGTVETVITLSWIPNLFMNVLTPSKRPIFTDKNDPDRNMMF